MNDTDSMEEGNAAAVQESVYDMGTERHVLELRAEAINLIAGEKAEREGKSDRLEIGVESATDKVAGGEDLSVGRALIEKANTASTTGLVLNTTVHGHLNANYFTDNIMLTGAMSETYAGALVTVAGMSDVMAAGGGMRVVAGADIRLSGLTGMEEKLFTLMNDGIMIDVFANAFEREFGTAIHNAVTGIISSKVEVLTATTWRPMMKTLVGLRSKNKGSAAGGDESIKSPPEAPPPPAGGEDVAAAGKLLSTGGKSVKRAASSPSGSIVNSLSTAGGLEEIATSADNGIAFGRTSDTASSLEDLQAVADDGVAASHASDSANKLEDLQAVADEELSALKMVPDDRPIPKSEIETFLGRLNKGIANNIAEQKTTSKKIRKLKKETPPDWDTIIKLEKEMEERKFLIDVLKKTKKPLSEGVNPSSDLRKYISENKNKATSSATKFVDDMDDKIKTASLTGSEQKKLDKQRDGYFDEFMITARAYGIDNSRNVESDIGHFQMDGTSTRLIPRPDSTYLTRTANSVDPPPLPPLKPIEAPPAGANTPPPVPLRTQEVMDKFRRSKETVATTGSQADNIDEVGNSSKINPGLDDGSGNREAFRNSQVDLVLNAEDIQNAPSRPPIPKKPDRLVGHKPMPRKTREGLSLSPNQVQIEGNPVSKKMSYDMIQSTPNLSEDIADLYQPVLNKGGAQWKSQSDIADFKLYDILPGDGSAQKVFDPTSTDVGGGLLDELLTKSFTPAVPPRTLSKEDILESLDLARTAQDSIVSKKNEYLELNEVAPIKTSDYTELDEVAPIKTSGYADPDELASPSKNTSQRESFYHKLISEVDQKEFDNSRLQFAETSDSRSLNGSGNKPYQYSVDQLGIQKEIEEFNKGEDLKKLRTKGQDNTFDYNNAFNKKSEDIDLDKSLSDIEKKAKLEDLRARYDKYISGEITKVAMEINYLEGLYNGRIAALDDATTALRRKRNSLGVLRKKQKSSWYKGKTAEWQQGYANFIAEMENGNLIKSTDQSAAIHKKTLEASQKDLLKRLEDGADFNKKLGDRMSASTVWREGGKDLSQAQLNEIAESYRLTTAAGYEGSQEAIAIVRQAINGEITAQQMYTKLGDELKRLNSTLGTVITGSVDPVNAAYYAGYKSVFSSVTEINNQYAFIQVPTGTFFRDYFDIHSIDRAKVSQRINDYLKSLKGADSSLDAHNADAVGLKQRLLIRARDQIENGQDAYFLLKQQQTNLDGDLASGKLSKLEVARNKQVYSDVLGQLRTWFSDPDVKPSLEHRKKALLELLSPTYLPRKFDTHLLDGSDDYLNSVSVGRYFDSETINFVNTSPGTRLSPNEFERRYITEVGAGRVLPAEPGAFQELDSVRALADPDSLQEADSGRFAELEFLQKTYFDPRSSKDIEDIAPEKSSWKKLWSSLGGSKKTRKTISSEPTYVSLDDIRGRKPGKDIDSVEDIEDIEDAYQSLESFGMGGGFRDKTLSSAAQTLPPSKPPRSLESLSPTGSSLDLTDAEEIHQSLESLGMGDGIGKKSELLSPINSSNQSISLPPRSTPESDLKLTQDASEGSLYQIQLDKTVSGGSPPSRSRNLDAGPINNELKDWDDLGAHGGVTNWMDNRPPEFTNHQSSIVRTNSTDSFADLAKAENPRKLAGDPANPTFNTDAVRRVIEDRKELLHPQAKPLRQQPPVKPKRSPPAEVQQLPPRKQGPIHKDKIGGRAGAPDKKTRPSSQAESFTAEEWKFINSDSIEPVRKENVHETLEEIGFIPLLQKPGKKTPPEILPKPKPGKKTPPEILPKPKPGKKTPPDPPPKPAKTPPVPEKPAWDQLDEPIFQTLEDMGIKPPRERVADVLESSAVRNLPVAEQQGIRKAVQSRKKRQFDVLGKLRKLFARKKRPPKPKSTKTITKGVRKIIPDGEPIFQTLADAGIRKPQQDNVLRPNPGRRQDWNGPNFTEKAKNDAAWDYDGEFTRSEYLSNYRYDEAWENPFNPNTFKVAPEAPPGAGSLKPPEVPELPSRAAMDLPPDNPAPYKPTPTPEVPPRAAPEVPPRVAPEAPPRADSLDQEVPPRADSLDQEVPPRADAQKPPVPPRKPVL